MVLFHKPKYGMRLLLISVFCLCCQPEIVLLHILHFLQKRKLYTESQAEQFQVQNMYIQVIEINKQNSCRIMA
jgi:hypothetical protein